MITKMHLDRGGFMKQYRDMQRIAALVTLTLAIFIGTIVYFNSRISHLEKTVLRLQSRLGGEGKIILNLADEKLPAPSSLTLKPALGRRTRTYRVLPKTRWVESKKLGEPEEKQNVSEGTSYDYNPTGDETPAWLGNNSNP